MKRRDFITLLGGAAAAWPVAARAQAEGVRRIGVLMGIAEDAEGHSRLAAFRQALRALGWSEGDNIEFNYRWGGGNPEQNRRLADELLEWRPDAILSNSTPAELPVQQPAKFELVVNLKTAKALGLTIPESFLLRADKVIEWDLSCHAALSRSIALRVVIICRKTATLEFLSAQRRLLVRLRLARSVFHDEGYVGTHNAIRTTPLQSSYRFRDGKCATQI